MSTRVKIARTIYRSRLTYGVFLGLFFGLSMFVAMGHYNLSGVIGAVCAGVFFGLFMSLITYDTRSYFIKKVKEGRMTDVRRYRALLRSEELPDAQEYAPYGEFLEGTEHLYRSTGWAYVAGPILFGGMFLLTLLFTRQYPLTVFFGITVMLYVIGAVVRKKRLAAIARLTDRIDMHGK